MMGIKELTDKALSEPKQQAHDIESHSPKDMNKDGDLECCKVFGYFTSYSVGPVRTLAVSYLGRSSLLHDAELLMRKATYPYEFFVVEYPHDDGVLSRYYDEHGNLKFSTHRSR